LGAGTYGIVREADSPTGKVAIKIILKKNVKGNEQMVYDEMAMLQNMHHPHIVKFHEWFESKVRITLRFWNAKADGTNRTNGTLLPSLPPAENCSIVFVRRVNSQKRMPPRPFAKCSKP
jgi:serine/threonine protein kinase